jgi:ribosomal protein S18 acetylase RimI-like enzyme
LHAKRLLYIDQIVVKDQYRGCGYGAKLLDVAQQLARELGLSVIKLEVWAFNENAKQFFMAHGFTTLRERMSLGL